MGSKACAIGGSAKGRLSVHRRVSSIECALFATRSLRSLTEFDDWRAWTGSCNSTVVTVLHLGSAIYGCYVGDHRAGGHFMKGSLMFVPFQMAQTGRPSLNALAGTLVLAVVVAGVHLGASAAAAFPAEDEAQQYNQLLGKGINLGNAPSRRRERGLGHHPESAVLSRH
jgi:hypothetical protein